MISGLDRLQIFLLHKLQFHNSLPQSEPQEQNATTLFCNILIAYI